MASMKMLYYHQSLWVTNSIAEEPLLGETRLILVLSEIYLNVIHMFILLWESQAHSPPVPSYLTIYNSIF